MRLPHRLQNPDDEAGVDIGHGQVPNHRVGIPLQRLRPLCSMDRIRPPVPVSGDILLGSLLEGDVASLYEGAGEPCRPPRLQWVLPVDPRPAKLQRLLAGHGKGDIGIAAEAEISLLLAVTVTEHPALSR